MKALNIVSFLRGLALVAGTALLASCGGRGGGGPAADASAQGSSGTPSSSPTAPAATPPTATAPESTPPSAAAGTASVSGYVRQAKPWVGASVTLRCAGGQVYTTTTDGNGGFTVATLPAATAQALPCAVQAAAAGGAELLHGWLEDATLGVAVTPLSDVTLTKAWAVNARTAFAAYPQSRARPSVAALSDATQFAVSGLDLVSGYRSAVFGSFQSLPPDTLRPGAADTDRAGLYNALRATLAAASWGADALRDAVAALADRRETFAVELHRVAVRLRIKPRVLLFQCNKPLALSTEAFECTISGTHLTRPGRDATGNTGTSRESELGLVVTRNDDVDLLKAQPPNKALKPTWCSKTQAERVLSQDSANPDGADPIGVFAETLVFSCGGLTSTSSLSAWVVVDDGVSAVADWPVAAGVVSWYGLPRYGRGSVSTVSASCVSKTTPANDPFYRSEAYLSGTLQAYLWPGERVDVITSNAPLARSAVEAIALNPSLVGNPAGVPPTTKWSRALAFCQPGAGTSCEGAQPWGFDHPVVSVLAANPDRAAYPIYVYALNTDSQSVSYAETQASCPASVRRP